LLPGVHDRHATREPDRGSHSDPADRGLIEVLVDLDDALSSPAFDQQRTKNGRELTAGKTDVYDWANDAADSTLVHFNTQKACTRFG
jgi:hypothetical protein